LTDDVAEDFPAERFRTHRSLRKTTKLEIGLVITLFIQFGGFVWWAATLNSSVAQLSTQLTDLRSSVADAAVMRYRVQQVELRVDRIDAASKRP
jgi:hypothetical protein